MSEKFFSRVCDVHRLVDNDVNVRQCQYCDFCRAWICADDLGKWSRRAQAMLKMWGNEHGPTTAPVAKKTQGCNCKKAK